MDEPSFDFVTHLEERLDLGRDAAFSMLADWLAVYQRPEPSPRLHGFLLETPSSASMMNEGAS